MKNPRLTQSIETSVALVIPFNFVTSSAASAITAILGDSCIIIPDIDKMGESSRTFSVEYTLYPPPLENQPEASTSKIPPTTAKHAHPIVLSADSDSDSNSVSVPVPVPGSERSETSTYYSALSLTLRKAQKDLNENLTSWKDAIGDREKSKEDPGTIGYGRGKAAVMSEDVRGELRQNGTKGGEGEGEGEDSDSSDES